MNRRAVLLAVVSAVAAGCSGGGSEQTAGQVVQFPAGKRADAPELKGTLLDGGSFDLATLKGKVVVLNFWASWCAPCRIEVADLEAVHKEMPGVAVVGLNTYDDKDKALAFIENKATYPSLLDTSGKLALAFRDVPPNALPSTIIVDAQGKIAAVIRRATTRDELAGLLTPLLAEKA